MKIEYDREADALFIVLKKGKPSGNIDIEDGVTVDLDRKRHIIGIEILDASRRFSSSELSSVTIENLLPVVK